jgi:methyltransferase (TIGR00027 family)
MIAARTRHLDDLLAGFHENQPCQVVNIGAGLDTRTYRIPLPPGSAVFDVDLPLMLRQRRKALPETADGMGVRRVEVPLDLRESNFQDALTSIEGFNRNSPTLYVWEGGSMYFTSEVTKGLLQSVARLMTNPRSRLWMDYVHESVVDGTCTLTPVKQFIEAMRTLGEPFIAGFSDLKRDAGKSGLRVREDTTSNRYTKSSEPVFTLYRFAVLEAIEIAG